MALITAADRVKETTTTTGTGTLSLDGAATQFQTFVGGVGNGATVIYTILDANGTAWETTYGVVTDATPDTLSRGTLIDSSTGSRISLSAGTHTVLLSTELKTHYQHIEKLRRYGLFVATSNGSSTQSVATGTNTKLTTPFNTEWYDLESWYDHTTARYTPLRAGIYLAGVTYAMDSMLTATLITYVFKNGANFRTIESRTLVGNSHNPGVSGCVPVPMNGSTDYIEIYINHDYGSNRNTLAATLNNRFWAYYLGPDA